MKNPAFFIANYLRDLFKREKVATRCIRCKRPLKDPESIKRGYGRVCWRKHLMEEMHLARLIKSKKEFDKYF